MKTLTVSANMDFDAVPHINRVLDLSNMVIYLIESEADYDALPEHLRPVEAVIVENDPTI